jgi:hypothetical protein
MVARPMRSKPVCYRDSAFRRAGGSVRSASLVWASTTLTSISRVNLNSASVVVNRSTSDRNSLRAPSRRATNAAPASFSPAIGVRQAQSISGMRSLVYFPLILAPVLELLACNSISWKLYLRGLRAPAMFKLSRVERRKCCTR